MTAVQRANRIVDFRDNGIVPTFTIVEVCVNAIAMKQAHLHAKFQMGTLLSLPMLLVHICSPLP